MSIYAEAYQIATTPWSVCSKLNAPFNYIHMCVYICIYIYLLLKYS